jgi:hypothetical protein
MSGKPKGYIMTEKDKIQLENARKNRPEDWNEGKKGRWANKELAREAGIKSGIVQRIRKEMRAKMLQSAIENGVEKLFGQSLKNLDMEGMKVVAEAMRLVGIDYAASEEAVQKIKADIKADQKMSGNVNISIKGLDVD